MLSGTLIIKNPRTADSGVYSCHAENRVYRDEISANIQVQGELAKVTGASVRIGAVQKTCIY